MYFEENERIDNETIKRIKRKKSKCPFNNKEEKESTEVSRKDIFSFYPQKREEFLFNGVSSLSKMEVLCC